MTSRRIAATLFAFFLSVAAVAGEGARAPLPDGFQLGIRVGSTSEFFDSVDACAVSVTRMTPMAMPSGMAKMLLQLYVPELAMLLENDLEIQYFSAMDPRFGDVLIVRNISCSDLLEAMAGHVGEIAEEGGDGTRSVAISRGRKLLLFEAGGDTTVVAPDAAALDRIKAALAGGWRPEAWGEGVVSAAYETPDAWCGTVAANTVLEEKLEELRGWIDGGELADRIDAPLRQGLHRALDVLKGYIPALKEEAAKLERAAAAVYVDGTRIGATVDAESSPGSYVAKMAAGAAERGGFEYVLARNVGGDAVTLMGISSLEKLFPDVFRLSGELYQRLGEAIKPGLKTDFAAAMKELEKVGFGELAVGQYADGEKLRQTCWIRVEDADKALEAYAASFALFNELAAAVDPAYADKPPVTVSDRVGKTGLEYKSIAWDPGIILDMVRFSARSRGGPEVSEEFYKAMVNLSLLVAAHDKYLIVVTDRGNESDLTAAIEALNGVAEPLWDEIPVQRALGELKRRQNAVVFTDYAFMMRFFTLSGLKSLSKTSQFAELDYLSKAIADIEPRFRDANSYVGLSFGAEDGRLAVDCHVPTDTVSIILYNMTILSQGLEQARGRWQAEKRREEAAAHDEDEEGDISENGE